MERCCARVDNILLGLVFFASLFLRSRQTQLVSIELSQQAGRPRCSLLRVFRLAVRHTINRDLRLGRRCRLVAGVAGPGLNTIDRLVIARGCPVREVSSVRGATVRDSRHLANRKRQDGTGFYHILSSQPLHRCRIKNHENDTWHGFAIKPLL